MGISTASNKQTPLTYKELEKELDFWKRKYTALGSATESLELKIEEQLRSIKTLEQRNEQLIQHGEIKDKITNQTMERANQQSNLYLEEIMELREEIRRLKDDNNDRMGNEDHLNPEG